MLKEKKRKRKRNRTWCKHPFKSEYFNFFLFIKESSFLTVLLLTTILRFVSKVQRLTIFNLCWLMCKWTLTSDVVMLINIKKTINKDLVRIICQFLYWLSIVTTQCCCMFFCCCCVLLGKLVIEILAQINQRLFIVECSFFFFDLPIFVPQKLWTFINLHLF